MKFFFKLIIFSLLLMPFALLAGVYLILDQRPEVSRDVELSPQEVRRARDIFAQYDPRKLRDGDVNTVVLGQADLDLAFNYLVDRTGRGSAQLTMSEGSALMLVTLRVPENPLGNYLNVNLEVLQNTGVPRVGRMRIGDLPVPAVFANFLLRRALDRLYDWPANGSADDLLHEVSFSPTAMQVTFQWDSRVTEVVRGALLSNEVRQKLEFYNRHLVEIAAASDASVSLAGLMQPLFEKAAERSHGRRGAAENRAVILLLSTYVNDRGIRRLAPESVEWPQPVKREVTLGGRTDLAQHFMTSAALAALGGGAVSNAIGLFKEVDDARGGSGFSFVDLCADHAGTTFGEWATSSARASGIQSAVAAAADESMFMPNVGDLPENMDDAAFKRRFGGTGGPRYNAMLADIERRVEALPLYRNLSIDGEGIGVAPSSVQYRGIPDPSAALGFDVRGDYAPSETVTGSQGSATLSCTGTAEEPCLIDASRATFTRLRLDGRYVILQGGKVNAARGSGPHLDVLCTYCVVRDVEVAGPEFDTRHSSAIGMNNNTVWIGGRIHGFGDNRADAPEQDYHGIKVMENDVWILDAEIYNNSGDSVQVGDASRGSASHVYIGGGYFHHNRENAVDIKDSSDVVVSGVLMEGFRAVASSPGEAVIVHDDAVGAQIYDNTIIDSAKGITSSGLRDHVIDKNNITALHTGIELRNTKNIRVTRNVIDAPRPIVTHGGLSGEIQGED